MNEVYAVIAAAGQGRRFGAPKSFVHLRGRRILDYSLEVFNRHPAVSALVLVLRDPAAGGEFRDTYEKLLAVVPGGEKRQDSVRAGFRALPTAGSDVVLIHDAARPLVREDLIDRVIQGARKHGAVVPALPVSDTIKQIDADGRVRLTLDRGNLVGVQTPQGFACGLLAEAYAARAQETETFTDEAALVESFGHAVWAVSGDSRNIKITRPEDIRIAEALIDG